VRRPDRRAYEQEEIEKEDCDENEAADEDVWTESHVGLVLGKVRGWDVSVLVVALVLVIMHAYQLRRKTACVPAMEEDMAGVLPDGPPARRAVTS
jgi:hypothetical protein